MYGWVLVLHVVAASVWTGGHLVLALGVLPRALKERDVAAVRDFEARYERIGIPALVAQVLSGIWLAHRMLPDPAMWIDWSHPIGRVVMLKWILLGTTVVLAIDARLRIIPRLDERNLRSLAWHIIPVTVISVLFVVVGVSFRTGWFMR